MQLFKKIDKWANTEAYYPVDILMFCLGVFLFWQGFLYIRDSDFLIELLQKLNFDEVPY